MVKAMAFVIRKTDLGAKKLATDLAKTTFLDLSLPNVHSVNNKCCHLRDFVIDNSIDIFCISEI